MGKSKRLRFHALHFALRSQASCFSCFRLDPDHETVIQSITKSKNKKCPKVGLNPCNTKWNGYEATALTITPWLLFITKLCQYLDSPKADFFAFYTRACLSLIFITSKDLASKMDLIKRPTYPSTRTLVCVAQL